MALTPVTFNLDEELAEDIVIIEALPKSSKTWALDFVNKRIGGRIDGDDALRQYVHKALITARNRFLIYDDTYGSELEDLIGQDLTPDLLETEIPRVVTEALIYDDRIADISDIEITRDSSDKLYVTFTVVKTDGGSIEAEVSI